jgi:1-acyl-sn-glycerol-3-phosphate acyltransferase
VNVRDLLAHGAGYVRAFQTIYHTLEISAPTVLDGALGSLDPLRADQRLEYWSRALLQMANVQLTVSGRENFDRDRAYLVLCNHCSHFDVPVFFQAYRRPVRMVAKKELFDIPLFGKALETARFPKVDRSNRAQAVESLRKARALLEDGTSLWIAPEGTRSKDPSKGLQPFKKGGFVLALEAELPILTVAIAGTHDILRPGTMNVRSGARVHVHFAPVIESTHTPYSHEARDALMAQVRTTMQAALDRAKQEREQSR